MEKHNYEIIEINFYCKQGEIDIIAKEKIKQGLVFVEVKTRTTLRYGEPKEAVNFMKKKHMFRTAKYYLYKNYKINTNIRFDVVEILISNNKIKINHIKNIEMM